jgi:long-chain acyl-CoA synthetase
MFCGSEERERTAFFFPNAHIFQSACVGLSYTGAFIGYISSKETFKEDLLKIKPTYLFGVPLLFQKIAQQVELKLTSMLGGFFKEKDLIGPTWKNRLFIGPIFRKILRKKLGFSSMKTLFCAGAALNSKTYDFYKYTFGFKVTSGYGLSETTGPLTSDPIGRKGASGKTSVNNKIEIRNKNEEGVGDVWAKGGNIFDGYLNDSEKKYFDDQGFFETGDRGYFDDDGFIYIVGRIKNQHKAADGRFYNIEAIAEKVLSKAHHIQQVAIHILNAQFPTALITLGEDRLDFEEYKNNDEFLEKLQAECFEIIDHLKKDHYYPIPKKFILIPPFTEDNGLLTPTKKIKVLKVLSLYDKVIESFSKKDGTEFLVFTDH